MKMQRLLDFHYEHRVFFGTFVLILVLGYFFDSKAKMDLFYDLLDQEKNLKLQLHEKEEALRRAGPIAARLRLGKTQKPLLDQLIQAAQSSHCILIDLQTELNSFANSSSHSQENSSLSGHPLLIKMTLKSDYAGFYQFLETLLRKSLFLQVDSFSMQDLGEGLLIALQLSTFPYLALSATTEELEKQTFCCKRDPFRDPPLQEAEQMKIQTNDLKGLLNE